MTFYRKKIPVIYSPGWEWGWVSDCGSFSFRDVDLPILMSSAVTTQR